MICPICNKYEATIHLTQISNGKKQELHICEFCAKKHGLLGNHVIDFSSLLASFDAKKVPIQLPLQHLGASPEMKRPVDEDSPDAEKAAALLSFQKTGRFRSPEDYDLLEDPISELIKRIHGAERHVGKHPQSYAEIAELTQKIEEQKRQLEAAVREECYEKAAELRDAIREMEATRDELSRKRG